ncbi:hypothetical protein A3860_10325 [Niastella vici]|uniref:Uncharacterized protein n=1 Tax=Niastella vici TaxID=1703345 RepID=A0A1V9FFC3_9BACT|nr:hypothetical protein A3860_10325 [Niastella vici]
MIFTIEFLLHWRQKLHVAGVQVYSITMKSTNWYLFGKNITCRNVGYFLFLKGYHPGRKKAVNKPIAFGKPGTDDHNKNIIW